MKSKGKEVPAKAPVADANNCDESLKDLATLRTHACRDEAEGSDGDSEACLAMQQMGQAMRSYQASLLTPPRPPKSGHSPSREHSGCGPLEQEQQLQEVPAGRMEEQEPPTLEQQQEELPQVGNEQQPEAAACPPLQLPPRPSPLSSPYVDLMDKLLSKII